MEGRLMKKVIVPKTFEIAGRKVTKEEVEAYFEKAGKAPSIKEQLVLKAFEITQETRVFFESEEVILLYSDDQTGIYLSCFNKTREEVSLEIPLSALRLEEDYTAYCVLTAEELGILKETLTLMIPDSGVLLVKLTKVNN